MNFIELVKHREFAYGEALDTLIRDTRRKSMVIPQDKMPNPNYATYRWEKLKEVKR